MKKALVIGCAMVLALAALSNAQDLTGKFALSPFAGLGLPMGDLADDDITAIEDGNAAFRKMGIKFGVNADYFVSPNYCIGLSFRYVAFGAKDITVPGEGTYESDSKLNTMAFTLNGRYYFGTTGTTRPYMVLGAGLAMATMKDIEAGEPGEMTVDYDSFSKPFILFGLGGDYFASPNVSIFAEGTFDYYFTDGAKLKVDGVDSGSEVGTNYFFLDFVVGARFYFGGAN